MIMGKTGNGTEFDVIVIGGGATGAGTARDCAMRGLRVLLLERFDYTNGATGRNHGLLHSGARYAVNDGESAAECIRENRILRRIASHCVEENGGLFISLPEDDLSYQDKFVESCRKAGIEAEAIDPKEAIRLEPSVNPSLTGAVKVPDGSIDPFRLTIANILDARAHGAVTPRPTELKSAPTPKYASSCASRTASSACRPIIPRQKSARNSVQPSWSMPPESGGTTSPDWQE